VTRWFPSLTRASSPGGNSARSLSRWVALEPAVSLTGIYYLGALRAAEEITRVLGHSTEAQEYRRLFDAGSRWTDANLGRTLAFSDDIVVAPGKDLTILL